MNCFLFFSILGIAIFTGCKKDKVEVEFTPNTGQIQVLNGCGYSGAAEAVRNFLSQKGFDIIEFGNTGYWNYAETIVVARTHNTKVARDLARVLNTENFVQIVDSSQMVEATVFVGKDYHRRITQ